ncbi:MAG: NmrA family NAD(P)-binding protein [Myxococcota bacterium]
MYAVAGVTGNTGAVVARTLLERGAPVRVIVRDAARGAPWRERGAEVAVADLGDEAALTEALRGVAGAYLLVPPQVGAADPVAAGVALAEVAARAAAAAEVPHVVLLSSVGAEHPAGTGPVVALHRAEASFRAASPALTALRAGYFLENYGAVLQVVRTDGVLPTFIAADQAVPTVSVRDIGRVAAELLLEGPQGDRVVPLAGPVDATPQDAAGALTALLGRPIALAAAPPEAAEGAFTGMGMPQPMAALYGELYQGIAAGRLSFPEAPRRGVVGLQDGLRALLG